MRPGVEWHPSPNYRECKPGRPITLVVIHATATSGIDSPRDWLCDPTSKLSAHYLIGRDGTALQLVDENDVAWHTGQSEWKKMAAIGVNTGMPSLNHCSIGVELVNSNDGIMEYPDAQLGACAAIVAAVCLQHGVKMEDVVGHKDIAPGRKTDPAGFPWESFRAALASLGMS